MRRITDDKNRQQACVHAADPLRDADCPDPVAAVGQHAGSYGS
jgi:hypothetical protein